MRLEIKGISKSYMNNKKKNKVLDNVNFDVEDGQFVTLLGPSGCGKTTLLTMIAGFHNSDSGEIILNGRTVIKPGPDRGFVFQNYALFPWMTVKDNIMYPMKQQKISKKESLDRLNYLLEMSQLKGKENLHPNQLSGGMKQRTAVVRALASKPEVLLMDEPLGAIDFQMRQIMQEELENLWLKDKTTVVMVTHDVDEAVYLSDRIIVFSAKGGTIIEDMKIDLPRPRNRDNHKYLEFKTKLTNILKESLKHTV
ncbi:ABC transporter ATP-binding protein SaoA [Clostridium sp. Marseille-Q2269]|uniref:ABC transporter ATP-binding protein SaoA n=1 Tax=Clostridium sp. Marseille-Q2269 TaxID=2942205 RepID=UPI00207454E4|nr:ABC transporter ATP-binding protein SaoA [Clostridium sp. Marseille-Q2269]